MRDTTRRYDDRIRCSACGFPCDPQTRPHGGKYKQKVLSKSVGGTTVYYDGDGAQGCPSCGCPEWDGYGSLGDMAGWHTKNK